MSAPRIPLSRPSIGDEDRRAVLDVLDGPLLANGPRCSELEARFARRFGTAAAIVSSGTAGLYLALRALGVDGGDVITPSYGFIATAHAIRLAGARPRFAEVDPRTLCLSVETVLAAWRPGVRAILPVHIFGSPAPVDDLAALAAERGVPLIEDACEALGARRAGRPVGTFGDAGVFAFYPNKQMTMGEGGLVIAREPSVADRVRRLRNQGRVGPGLEFSGEGFNFRITEMQAALGIAQLERVDSWIGRRDEIAREYRSDLAGQPGIELLAEPPAGDRRSWFAFPVFLPDRAARDGVRAGLGRAGIESAPYFPALHRIPPYDDPSLRAGPMELTEALADRGLAIPFYPDLRGEERREVVERLRELTASEAVSRTLPTPAGGGGSGSTGGNPRR